MRDEGERLPEAELAYLACLADNFSSVRVERFNRKLGVYRQIAVEFNGLTGPMVKWLTDRFPDGYRRRTGNGSYAVTYVTRHAALVILEAYPHLKVKQDEARLVFRFMKTVNRAGSKVTQVQSEERERIDDELKALKRSKRKLIGVIPYA